MSKGGFSDNFLGNYMELGPMIEAQKKRANLFLRFAHMFELRHGYCTYIQPQHLYPSLSLLPILSAVNRCVR